jgi:hypothetical protein
MLHKVPSREVHLNDKLMTARAHLICSNDYPQAWLAREPYAEECRVLLEKIIQIKNVKVKEATRVLIVAVSKADHGSNRVSDAQRSLLTALSALP